MEFTHMDERSVDETLRMIARMPAPEGMEARLKAGIRLVEKPGRVLAWPAQRRGEGVWAANEWLRSGWLRGAAAAAIALVVAGGGWGIYTRVAPAQPPDTVALPHVQPAGTFSEAGAMRRPQTVTGPQVKPATQSESKNDGKAERAGAGPVGTAKTSKQVSTKDVPARTQ
jgi:hypothetical protein